MSIWILLAIVLAILSYMTHPSLRYAKMHRWRGAAFAHRGLHDLERGVVENTLPAFEAACRAGYGVELDVRLTRDGQAVVFHDDNLARLCGDARAVCDVPLAELRSFRLAGVEGARIPTLREALDCVNGRAPLLIELKTGRRNGALCRTLMEHLAGYRGAYIVESFNPLIVRWFRKNAPAVPRGQLVAPARSYRPHAGPVLALGMASLVLNALARPDFVAYDAVSARFLSPRFQRAVFRTPLAAWTVRDEALADAVLARGEMCVFEGVRPPRPERMDASRADASGNRTRT